MSAPQTGAEILLRTLAANGVDTCFINPGTSEMHFVAALDRVPEMRGVLTLFEGVATGAADGYARVAGRPAASLLHLAPGLANGMANLHNAQKARSPVINIVGEHATTHDGLDAPLSADVEQCARPVSRWVRRVRHADEVAEATQAALAAACGGVPGVATLIVAADASWESVAATVPLVAVRPAPTFDDRQVEATVAALAGGSALLLLDGRALADEAVALAAGIAAKCGARVMVPAFFSRLARGAGLPQVERLPYFPEAALAALAGVRTLLLVGAQTPVSFFAYPRTPGSLVPEGTAVQVLAAPEQDAGAALRQLAQRVGATAADAVRAVSAVESGSVPTDARWNVKSVAQRIAARLPAGCVVVDESGTAGPLLHGALDGAAPHELLTLTGGAIGSGMPMAVGAAIAAGGRRVLNLQADGAAAYTLQALWTQAREQLNITTVVFANRQYRILQVEMARVGAVPGPRAASLMDLGHPDLDWVRLAQGCGVEAVGVDSVARLDDALTAFLGRQGPNLIEVLI